MTVRELAAACGFETATQKGNLEAGVTGGYCGDLLSWVMGRAQAGNAWVTVMGNANVIAVALLTGVSCVVLAENAELDTEAAKRAEENGIAVLKCSKSAYDIAVCIHKALNA